MLNTAIPSASRAHPLLGLLKDEVGRSESLMPLLTGLEACSPRVAIRRVTTSRRLSLNVA